MLYEVKFYDFENDLINQYKSNNLVCVAKDIRAYSKINKIEINNTMLLIDELGGFNSNTLKRLLR